ncbi:acetyl-CoA carboxylase biotin carboxylase subunit [Fimbriimonas ginsengisoli]|uniref:biotin carboxylase n=1 Tax=Fimbriimonas ginsengisoli Gsoil 348 TaxID=661478 RepID=A0A068NTX7_FIMGI|nr:acetyl-CoA carboxylase biotin carboxylase subunit [Fimbriimonas ginsengisoli]AIE86822.1 Acetyl/propionyl-CoA carboxylase, alpha subunit [Fimbriimonas ginsengisoli Gsoil 348]
MLKKVLIANRGEIACRVIRACRELDVRSVAIYSEADRESLHTKIADEAICVGAGSNSDSYLNLANVLMACQISGAEAVHPGYGYFSERANFAVALNSIGIQFIGPPPDAIEAMGDKASAKRAAIASNCPVVPGSPGIVMNENDALDVAEEIGYPVLLKAVAGGGGRGIRRVDEPEELAGLWKTAQAEAQASFGSGEILIEKCVINPRHVEIQVIGDSFGNMVYLGERECSIQNLRHQKLIEEAPYAALPEEVRRTMGEAAVRVAQSVGYQNAGTVEFLVDSNNDFYFLEMNTRLQVEHPVTEEITGIDLVHLMLRIASGEPLPIRQEDVRLKGHAIEARITAQDPDKEFAPSTGKITKWCAPMGRGIRMETHCYAGFTVSPFYDPMLAKLIVRGENRDEAVRKLQAALYEFEVEGIATNIPFLRRLCASEGYVAGEFDTGYVGRFLSGEES